MKFSIPNSKAEVLVQIQNLLGKEHAPENRGVVRAAVYSRKSRMIEGQIDYSMEFQPDKSEAFALQQGWKIVFVYADPDFSGRNSKRKGLQRLIRSIKAGKVDVVVVHQLDRLYRNLSGFLNFLILLQEYNVRFVSVTENIDSNTPWGKLIMYVLGSIAEMWVWQVSLRTREAKNARAHKGLPNGHLPLGYCRGNCLDCTDPNGENYCPNFGQTNCGDGRIPTQHPIDRYAVQYILNKALDGWSDGDIAHVLSTQKFELPDGCEVKFRTKGNPGRSSPKETFSRDTIRGIVRNPFYAGIVAQYPRAPLNMNDDLEHPERIKNTKPNGNPRIPENIQAGLHDGLITYDQWKRIQQIRAGRQKTPTTRKSQKRIYQLTGIAKCWECYQHDGRQASLRGNTNGKNKRYLRCATMQDRYRKLTKPEYKANGLGIVAVPQSPAEYRMIKNLIERHHSLPWDHVWPQAKLLISRLVIPQEWGELIAAYYLSDDGMAVFQRENYNLRAELGRTQELFNLGHIQLAELKHRTLAVQRKLAKLQPSTQPEAREIMTWLSDFPMFWQHMTPNEQRVLLDIIFDGMYFDGDGQLRHAQANAPFHSILNLPEDGMVIL